MNSMFKIGDLITTNKKLDEEYSSRTWWNECKNTIMTIKSIRNGRSHPIMEVEENGYEWVSKWVVPYEFEFIKEEEFMV